MENEQSLKWEYENNVPSAIIRAGFNHAWIMSIVILILSIGSAIFNIGAWDKLFYFVGAIVMTVSLFMIIMIVPLIFLHYIHYSLFKKFLLENKFEYVIVIAWTILFSHFLISYYLVDYLVDNISFPLSTNEYVFLFVGHMIGLIYGFVSFQRDFYTNFFTKDASKLSIKIKFEDEKNFF